MRIAFFGGSFDPPHRGHLAIARAAIERLALDKVWMAPAGTQPLKRNAGSALFSDRLAMVELAVAEQARIVASGIDAPRADGQPNFTIDVLGQARNYLQAQDRLFFLLGADAFLSLPQWHRGDELPFACDFIVAGRPGFKVEDLSAALPGGIRAAWKGAPDLARNVIAWELRNEAGQRSNLYLMPDLREEISATDIRAAIAGDLSAKDVLCPAVLQYIAQHGLYR